MRKLIRIMSVLCLLIAAITLVTGIPVIFGTNNGWLKFAMFRLVQNGGVMGFIGNLMNIALLAYGFTLMGWYGFKTLKSDNGKAVKAALIAGGVMSILAVISLICSISSHNFTLGDILILIFPIGYTGVIFTGTDIK